MLYTCCHAMPIHSTAANADAEASASRADRKSADAAFLTTANLAPELSRVNSTPLSSDAIDALGLPSSSPSSSTNHSLIEPSPLTMAPPKPGPADTLYPSPSGGFVPSPEEGQDWRLKPPPPGRSRDTSKLSSVTSNPAPTASTSSPSSASRALPPLSESSVNASRPTSGISPTAASSTSTPTRPPSLPSCPETASRIASASSSSLSRRSSQASHALASPKLRPTSSSASSRHRLSTAASSSQSASLAQASQTAPITGDTQSSELQQSHDSISSRPGSIASFQTARNDDSVFAIRIRDFAFPDDDPRHKGDPLAEPQSSADHYQDFDEHGHSSADVDEDEFYIEGAEDENEFDGDQGDNASVPEGVYKVLYAFEPVSEHELAVHPGEVVHVIGSLDGGWAIALKEGDESVKGLVPATYLEWSAPLPEWS
ncbi:cytoskeletal protein binding protein [Pseudozyma hubeiensis SY62]|uniref:Cytoskeletal protein binding protein n=1 Tax=Pseudozyma hubeiensis (strain SY62) TaxID=1305764 RepID=R9P1A4_PSEHS|nr:cytoskeletal protein binding protein [Pseudozyma hubeiensis SY62]GAC95068.1 cytoskeletal protein binding protein [Pseudozyma hubeiensis SY62]